MSKRPQSTKQIQFSSPSLSQKLLNQDDLSTSRSSEVSNLNPENKKQGKKGMSDFSSIKKGDKEKKEFSWPVYKKFFSYTMKRWKLALASLIFTMVSGFLTSLIPYLIGDVLDSITEVREQEDQISIEELNGEILYLLYVTIGLGITTHLRFLTVQTLQEKLSIDMKMDIYSKFIKNDIPFFEQYKSGEFVSRLGNDINQAKSAVSNNLTFLLRNLVTIVGNIVFLFVMSWKLSLSVMTILPFYVASTVYYSKRFKPLVKEYSDVNAQISAHVSEKFAGIQLVKAYSNEDNEIETYRTINGKLFDVAMKKTHVQGFYMTCSTFLPVAGNLIVLWYGGKLAIEGNAQLSPGQLTSFIMYCTYLANNTSGISSSYANIINGTAAVQKVFDMLKYEPKMQQNEGQKSDIEGDITFENVTFSYPSSQTQIFKDLSFKINKGQYVAFAGQSGSGKSTIIKLIEKFYKTTEGKIYFSGMDSEKLNSRELRKKIGMVNQQATIFSGTIEDNITYGLENYTQEQLVSASKRAGCLEFIYNVTQFPQGFQTLLGEKGSNLSGGQRQRISIARALIRKPKIIIFDEATSALDANSQQMVQESIQGLATNKEQKITIIVIAHRLSTIMNADKIMMMKEGRIIEEGTHEELKNKKGYYYELVQKQLQES